MPETRHIKGWWWPAKDKGNKAFGTLALHPQSSARLEINLPRLENGFSEWPDTGVIHGEDRNGRPITLLATGRGNQSLSGALKEIHYHSLCVLLGIEVADKLAFRAKKLTVEAQQLFGWFNRSGFINLPPESTETVRLSYGLPADSEFDLDSGVHVKIGIRVSDHDKWQERKIREDAFISFDTAGGFGLEDCFRSITAIRMLLHLAAMKRVEPVAVRCEVANHGIDFNGQWIAHEVEIWNAPRGEPESELPLEGLWTFTFKDVEENAASFFSSWFKFYDEFREAIDCYSSTIYHRLPSSITNLSLTQALDAYHGVKFKTSQDFSVRVRELLQIHQNNLHGLVSDVDAFAKTVQATRNYYTHHNSAWLAKGAVTDPTEIFRLNEKLIFLFRVCVLSDLGIASDRFSRLKRGFASQITNL